MCCGRQKSCAWLIRVTYNGRSIIRTFSENGKKFIISKVCYIERFCKGLLSSWGRALVQYIEGSYYRVLVLLSVYYLFRRNFVVRNYSSGEIFVTNKKFVTFSRQFRQIRYLSAIAIL